MGQCLIDWATAVVGEADRELRCVSFTYHGRDQIYETSAQSTDFPGTLFRQVSHSCDRKTTGVKKILGTKSILIAIQRYHHVTTQNFRTRISY